MRNTVDERPDPQHAAHANQLAEARNPAQRRDGERRQDEHQHPEAGPVDDIVERPRAVHDGVGIP
jgi:hypothetical protein